MEGHRGREEVFNIVGFLSLNIMAGQNYGMDGNRVEFKVTALDNGFDGAALEQISSNV